MSKCEAPALGSAVGRMIRALVRRATDGDTEALEQLLELEKQTSAGIKDALAGMRQVYSLGELSRVTGTSRQAVLKRSS